MKIKLALFDADGTLWNSEQSQNDLVKLLERLRSKKISCVVITYQSYRSKLYSKIRVRFLLRKFRISRYFKEIYLSEKEKHRTIKNTLISYDLKPSEVILIGDRYKGDYLEAKKSHVKPYLLNKSENQKYKVKKYSFYEITNLI